MDMKGYIINVIDLWAAFSDNWKVMVKRNNETSSTIKKKREYATGNDGDGWHDMEDQLRITRWQVTDGGKKE